MKHSTVLTKFATAVAILTFAASTALSQKMTWQEVVQKHLESIGTSENRSALKDMTALGGVRLSVLRLAGIGGGGNVVFASEGSKMALGLTYNIADYPNEFVLFDGKDLRIAYGVSEVRSYFGDFLYRNQVIVNRALLGGTLSAAWAFYDPTIRKSRIEFKGTKKIDGKEVYALDVLPKGGSDLEIQVFFDKQTFQHVRTTYKRIISASQGATPEASAQNREERQSLTEDFSDFRNESGLTLPHSYRIYLLMDGQNRTREYEWTISIEKFLFNQGLDASTFRTK